MNPCDFYIFNAIHVMLTDMGKTSGKPQLRKIIATAIRKLNSEGTAHVRVRWDVDLLVHRMVGIKGKDTHIPQH